jgi:hypothetical protein
MTSIDELKTTIRRNTFLGMWAAEKLNLVGRDAKAYADALAMGTSILSVAMCSAKFARTSTPRAWSNRMT